MRIDLARGVVGRVPLRVIVFLGLVALTGVICGASFGAWVHAPIPSTYQSYLGPLPEVRFPPLRHKDFRLGPNELAEIRSPRDVTTLEGVLAP